MKLPVHEFFETWQGEGVHLGRHAAFIRLFGCPVHCPWCDSAGTWHPDHVPEVIERHDPVDLAAWAAKTGAPLAVITGGEPAVHDLTRLTAELRRRGLRTHIETSGAFALRGTFDWITVSPKEWRPPLADIISRADEIKIIVDRPEVIAEWESLIARHYRTEHLWLHPEWSRRDDPEIIEAINRAVLEGRHPYRAGYQVHKIYGVR